jgi:hypothetical protein
MTRGFFSQSAREEKNLSTSSSRTIKYFKNFNIFVILNYISMTAAAL